MFERFRETDVPEMESRIVLVFIKAFALSKCINLKRHTERISWFEWGSVHSAALMGKCRPFSCSSVVIRSLILHANMWMVSGFTGVLCISLRMGELKPWNFNRASFFTISQYKIPTKMSTCTIRFQQDKKSHKDYGLNLGHIGIASAPPGQLATSLFYAVYIVEFRYY